MYVHPSGKFWKIFLSARILYQPHSYCVLPHHVLQINIFVFYGLIIVFSWWGPGGGGGDQDHNHYHRHVEQRPNHVSMVMWLYGHVFKAVASAVTPTNGSGVEDDYCHVQKTALTVECYMSGITCQGSRVRDHLWQQQQSMAANVICWSVARCYTSVAYHTCLTLI